MLGLTVNTEFFILQLLVFLICRGVLEVIYRKTELKHFKAIVSVQKKTAQWSHTYLIKIVFWIVAIFLAFPIAYIYRDHYFILGLTMALILFFVDIFFDYKFISRQRKSK